MAIRATVRRESTPAPIIRKRSALRRFLPTAGDLFVLPYAVFLLAFGILPAVYALVVSFSSFTEGTPEYFNAGLRNFITAFHDFRFGPAFVDMFQFLIISVPFGVIAVTLIALLLHARLGWFSDSMRTLYFLPGAVAGPASVLIALFMLDPTVSPFRGFFNALHMHGIIQVIQPGHLPVIFTLLGFFVGAGGWIAILYGGLKGIPGDLIEAAQIDGANAWQTAIYVKLPMIWRYLVYFFIITFAGNIQIFTEPQIISYSFQFIGLATVPPYWSPNQLGYFFAFQNGDFGAAAVISLLMVAIGLVGAFAVIQITGFFRTDPAAA